jgi:hypothetical protein
MSNWIDIDKDDISISKNKQDDFGNCYVTIKVKDMLEILKEKGIINE